MAELFALFRRSPAFKRVFLADVATQLGDGGLVIAFPLLILHHTHDVTLTGLAFSGEILAIGLLSPLAGSLADRLEQKALMIGANLVRAALLGFLLMALAAGAPMAVCLGISVALGCASAFFHPARAAFLRRLLDGEALEAAIALEGTLHFLMRIVAPAAMGALVAAYSPHVAIWTDIGAYAVAVLLLAPVWVTGPRLAAPADADAPGAWKEGWRLIGASPTLKELLVLDVLLSMVGMAAFSLTVAFLDTKLGLPASDNGWLLATTGVTGAIGTQLAGRVHGRARFAVLTAMVAATYLLVPAMPSLAAMMAVWALRGVAIGALGVLFNQTIVKETPAALMGRVNAAWGLAACLASFAGTAATPLLLRTIGAGGAFAGLGAILTLTALGFGWLALRRRPVLVPTSL